MRFFVFLFLVMTLTISPSQSLFAKTIQLMSYNVENLFDCQHDVENKIDKLDWTFLPKNTPGKNEACQKEKSKHHKKECLATDWTSSKLEIKLLQIAEVVTKERSRPDFLGVVEVENSHVVGLLAKKLGYESFEITESPDARGVDVALLYNPNKMIRKISKTEHIVPVEYATRNILEVEFLIDEKYPLTLFVNHWPSLANPDSWRVKAAEILLKRSQEIMAKNPQMSIIAMGDFNTIDDNSPHPFNTILFKDHFFADVSQVFQEDKSIDELSKKKMAAGTYYYAPKGQWNQLDHFFVNKNLLTGNSLKLIPKSFEIYAPTFIIHELKKKDYNSEGRNIKKVLSPQRYNFESVSKNDAGFSDHFPILVKLEYPDLISHKKKVKNQK